MSNGERCKECRQWIAASELKCSCGWKPERVREEVPAVADHGCRYQLRGERCPLPGSMSSSTHRSEIWYCYGHYRALGNAKEGEEWFDYAKKHYDEIIEDLKDWRLKLHKNFKSINVR